MSAQMPVSIQAANLVSDADLSTADVAAVLEVAAELRDHAGDYRQSLSGRVLALLFEKPSLRTRVTFEVAMSALGGTTVFVDCRGEEMGQREAVRDIARSLD